MVTLHHKSTKSVLFVSLLCILLSFVSAIPDTEVAVVQSLISTYNIASACGVSGWTATFAPTDPCTWPRIICVSDAINTLDLSSCGLSGALPNLSPLKNLVTLKLNNNSFTGEVPSYELPLIATVDLSNNALTGSLNNVIRMRGADFVPFINVANNQFTSRLDQVTALFSGVVEFIGGNNPFNETTALAFGSTGLRLFSAPNAFSSPISISGMASALEQLNLENARLTGPISSVLPVFPAIKVANLNKNNLTGSLPASLPGALEELYVSGNVISGQVPSTFFSSSSVLRVLDISNNQISGSLPTTAATSRLTTLIANNNSISCSVFLPTTLTTCSLSNNYLCPDILSNTSSQVCVPSTSACFASASSCKTAASLNELCPTARPTLKSACNTASLQWEFPWWHAPAANGDLAVLNGTLVFPVSPFPISLSGSLIYGSNSSDSSSFSQVTFAQGSQVRVSGSVFVGSYSRMYINLPLASTLNVVNPNSSSLLPVVQVLGNMTYAENITSAELIVDATTTIPAVSLPPLWFLHAASIPNVTFTSTQVLLPSMLNSTFQAVGILCSGYFVRSSPTAFYTQYFLTNSAVLCRLPPRVVPPPLPPRGFDVGALIGSLFAALVLVFVCFAAAMVANEDWHYLLPYQD